MNLVPSVYVETIHDKHGLDSKKRKPDVPPAASRLEASPGQLKETLRDIDALLSPLGPGERRESRLSEMEDVERETRLQVGDDAS
jgi:hypothetical protein